VAVSDRELILSRIRAATADVPATEGSRSPNDDHDPAVAYHRSRTLNAAERSELFIERCREYAATVSTCADTAETIAAAVHAVAVRQAAASLAVPGDLDPGWLTTELSFQTDAPLVAPLSFAQLNATDGVLTACELAIAETGTIVLNAGSGQGRRVISLLPDLHICVVRAAQIVASVPEAIAALQASFHDGAPVTLISGPSATSDIELTRIEGVHGPRRLEIVVAD
jgi:L-lactate dehydrogenase complex protein LldG